MSIINLSQISHDFGNKPLFENISLSLDQQTRAGLVGRNGTGKTTLFKIISGEIEPLDGAIHKARDYRIGYFSQDFSFSSTERLWDWLYNSREDLMRVQKSLKEVSDQLSSGDFQSPLPLSDGFGVMASSSDDAPYTTNPQHSDLKHEKLLNKLHDLQTEYELLGGFSYENEIKSLLQTFGFTPTDYDRPIDDLSGGEKTRVRLINIILNRFDFILFDEPTNHLDLLTVDWFIQYLRSVTCGYLIISHDRYLLDQVATKIYELKHRKINTFSGNFSAYQTQAVERDAVLLKQYQLQQKQIKQAEDFIAKNLVRASTSNRAKSRIKMLNRLDRISVNARDKHIKLKIQSSHRSGNDIYRLKNLSIGYPNNTLASDINLNLHYRDKVCLIGANGSGKTTLLKILTGDLQPLCGDLWTGHNLSVGYYDQMHIDLDGNLTVLETIWNLVPNETYGFVMTYLARFGFHEDMVEQKVRDLSGGEKSRLYLAQLIFEKPNLLILDEPTNHLDISMIQSLEVALRDYDGTVILVSHDRYFIQAITNDFWVIKDKTIKHHKDTFDSLIERISPYKKSDSRPQTSDSSGDFQSPSSRGNFQSPSSRGDFQSPSSRDDALKATKPQRQKPKKVNPIILQKLHNEIEALETQIKNAEKEIADTQSLFAEPSFYAKQANIDTANKKIAALKQDIETLKVKKDSLETEFLTLNYEQ